MDLRNTITGGLFNKKIMSKCQLPTYVDVYCHFLEVSTHEKYEYCALKKTSENLINIWHSASLPHQTIKSTRRKLSRHVEAMKNLKKSKRKLNVNTSCEKYVSKYNTLFDMCSCQCENKCTCLKPNIIPPIEVPFLTDQRTNRLLYIDITCTEGTSYQSRNASKIIRLDIQHQSAAIASTS